MSPWSRSFELVYYDPDSRFAGRTPFRDAQDDPLTTPQRIAYLEAYAAALRQANGLGADGLSSEVVGDAQVQEAVARLKPRPRPRLRSLAPLRYWRWKLQGAEGDEWTAPDYDDSLWNELEAPTALALGRALLLRCAVPVEPAERHVLDIEAIHDGYQLWVDGVPAARHEGYEPHEVDVTGRVRPGRACTFALRVAAGPGHQAGLAGPLELVGTRAAYVDDVFVRTLEAHPGRPARVRVAAAVRNAGDRPFSGRLRLRLYPWLPQESPDAAFEAPAASVDLGPGQRAEHLGEHLVPGARLWSPQDPALYRVEVVLEGPAGDPVDDWADAVGLRAIRQRGGRLYLNERPFFVRSFGDNLGFPPAADTHGCVCPPDDWVVRDLLLARGANANTVRLHPWGFTGQPGEYNEYGWPEWGLPADGTNYLRIAEIADQLGLCLIWATRHWTLWGHGFRTNIDLEQMERLLGASVRRVRNRPSIIAYEGLNEVGGGLHEQMFRVGGTSSPPWVAHLLPEEVEALVELHRRRFRVYCARYIEQVNAVDDSRLVCPNAMWGPGYQANPQHPEFVQFDDESIFTSADNLYWECHDYIGWYRDFQELYPHRERFWPADRARPVLLGECGAEGMPDWARYRGLPWRNLWLNNGRPCAATETARLGRPLRRLRDPEVHLSQAYQGLCIQQTASFVRTTGCDGMNVNLIADGLAHGNYHKGITDLFRRAKLGYWAARMAYQPTLATGMDGDFVLAAGDALQLRLVNDLAARAGRPAVVEVRVCAADGAVVDGTRREAVLGESGAVDLGPFRPRFPAPGLYRVEYTVLETG